MTTTLAPDLRLTARTFAGHLTDLGEQFVGRDEAITVLALATLCREHVLLLGPPGTAKTALLERYSSLLQARYFSYLLSKFTEPAELFGVMDVHSFQEDAVYRVNTDGMLPTAEFAFLDEVFHGSSAILNSLLTLINERTFHNGSRIEPVPLISLLGAANEMPADDPVLLAFCDRFLFRCELDYVPDESIDDVLQLGWAAEQRLIRDGTLTRQQQGDGVFPVRDLKALQAAVADINLAGVRGALSKILVSFREAAVPFSDRRAVKAQKAIAASALLAGRGQAEVEDLSVLTYLWTSPYDAASIRDVVESHGVPLARRSRTARDLDEIRYSHRELANRIPLLDSREECRELLGQLGRLVAEVRSTHPQAVEALREIQRSQTEVIMIMRDRYSEDGGFDV